MAGKSTISITFKLDGDGKGFKELSADAEGLKKVISSAVSEAQALNSQALNFASIATGLQAVQRSFDELRSGMQDLADAYAVQEVAETKLATVMSQRMGATAAQIQSIKDLCSAQQELGVIGDEVQLSGAQQVATFLTEADSLAVLIPAMNNLLAQQKGLTATTQDAATVGNLMGKVMQGQTSALTRVGITFSEAEEKVLKYGTESERAAMLAQVITNNVGQMNAALAQTESGKQQQLVNTLGDMKETLGDIVNGALPFVTIASHALTATVNIGLLVLGVQKLLPVLTALNVKAKAASAATLLMGVNAKRSAAVMRVFTAAVRTGTNSVTAFKLALRGLLIAMGVGVALVAVSAVIEKISSASAEAADKERELTEELANLKKELRDIGASAAEGAQKEIIELEKLYTVAKNEAASKKERAGAIKELQSKYPAYFSNLNAENINVKNLTSQYDSLRDAIIEAARARAASKKIEENMLKLIDTEQQIKAAEEVIETVQKKYDAAAAQMEAGREQDVAERNNRNWFVQAAMSAEKVNPATVGQETMRVAGKDMQKYNSELVTATANLGKLKDQRNEIVAANQDLAAIIENTPGIKLGSNATPTTLAPAAVVSDPKWTEDAATLKEIEENIQILTKQLQTATIEEAVAINQQIEAWNKKADAIRNAGKATTETTATWRENAATLKEIGENLDILTAKLQTATAEEAVAINQQIASWNAKADAIRNAGKAATETATWRENAATLKEIGENIQILENKLESATVSEAALINQQIEAWNKKADAIRNAGIETKKTMTASEGLRKGWGTIKGVSSSVESITDALKGNGSAWQAVCSIVDGFFGIYDGIKTVIEIIELLSAASAAHAATKAAEAGAETAAATTRGAAAVSNAVSGAAEIATNKLVAASFKELAAAEYMAAHAAIPFAGYGIAAGYTAAMLATVTAAGIPALADGGIASGPTLALVGEYAGASGNPEVIAPLDKLRSMLQPDGYDLKGVEFKIQGRTLVALLDKEAKLNKRS